ncbi:RnfH family protein [Lysobacter sp. SG-8]|uniref:UPF0125 protein H4F99_12300 n=1 Tax=Marilutibacter penaei TaxID=2759900 RepID=A0A7W3U5E9_9GAMM|nr:RnfH family protein [Lysobacter penaei]MBB1089259.1 RnfH family protein [Lysobacter penaei]
MRVEVLMAWPGRHESRWADVEEGARVADALACVGWLEAPDVVGLALHGRRVESDALLSEGDRIELLRPLEIDPKEARRRRAAERDPKAARGRG